MNKRIILIYILTITYVVCVIYLFNFGTTNIKYYKKNDIYSNTTIGEIYYKSKTSFNLLSAFSGLRGKKRDENEQRNGDDDNNVIIKIKSSSRTSKRVWDYSDYYSEEWKLRNIDDRKSEPRSKHHIRRDYFDNETHGKAADYFTSNDQNLTTTTEKESDEFDKRPKIIQTQPHVPKYTGKLAERPLEVDGKGCVPAAKWHDYVPTTCNFFHEVDMSFGVSQDAYHFSNMRNSSSSSNNNNNNNLPQLRFMFKGAARMAWLLEKSSSSSHNATPPLILKTIRYEKDYSDGQYYRQRKDAIATERLTSSPHVVDIYGYCGFSVLNEFADGGDLSHGYFWNGKWDAASGHVEKLIYARDAALGLADIHAVGRKKNKRGDEEGIVTMVHHDIRSHNFLNIGGKLKYHDFNQAKFLKWNPKTGKRCGFYWIEPCTDRAIDVYPRAPEECRGTNPKKTKLTELVETYRLGTFFFKLLTNDYPYKFETTGSTTTNKTSSPSLSKVRTWILDEKHRPKLPKNLEKESRVDDALKLLVRSMTFAMEKDVDKRPSSRELANLMSAGVEVALKKTTKKNIKKN